MKTALIIILSLFPIVLGILLWILKIVKEKHFCNYCEIAFVFGKKNRQRTHCPYCSNALTEFKEK